MWWDQFNGLLELTLDYEHNESLIVDVNHGELRRRNTASERLPPPGLQASDDPGTRAGPCPSDTGWGHDRGRALLVR